MSGDLLMKVLLAEYAVIMAVYGFERNWPMTLYWFGAIILNAGVLLANKGG